MCSTHVIYHSIYTHISHITSLDAVDQSLRAVAEEPRTSAPQSDKVTDGLRLLEVVDSYNFSAIEQRSRLIAGMPAVSGPTRPTRV